MDACPKPDRLPGDLAEIATDTVAPPLVLDLYLSRYGVISRVVDTLDLNISPQGRELTHEHMAHLYRAVTDDRRRIPTIVRDTAKYDIIAQLGEQYGFAYRKDQDSLRKSQLVHILLTELTGGQPSQFCLPSDPDPSTQQNVDDRDPHRTMVMA